MHDANDPHASANGDGIEGHPVIQPWWGVCTQRRTRMWGSPTLIVPVGEMREKMQAEWKTRTRKENQR